MNSLLVSYNRPIQDIISIFSKHKITSLILLKYVLDIGVMFRFLFLFYIVSHNSKQNPKFIWYYYSF